MANMAKIAYMARAQMDSKARHKSKGSRQSRRIALEMSYDRTSDAGVDRVTATDAKNEFGRVLENVIRGGRVFITKHDAPKAVLISIDDFETLSRSATSKLNALSGEFDEMLARMQLPGARARMKDAFDATPRQLGRAAVRLARKGG
jgi:prevent-host-death family protein